jgi:hypothetical protein
MEFVSDGMPMDGFGIGGEVHVSPAESIETGYIVGVVTLLEAGSQNRIGRQRRGRMANE